jgi:DNA-binding transcriptional ArsR family regulator
VGIARSELLCLDLPQVERLRRGVDPEAAVGAFRWAKAFSDPTRMTIALALREGGELCVCDLAWITARAENLVGHHLSVLRSAGLARSRREQRMVFYTLTETGRQLLDAHVKLAELAR